MTRRMTLLAIAAIATTTFMSTFAHAINVNIKDKADNIHTFENTPLNECKKFDAVIEAVGGITDAGVCYLYGSGDCSSNPEEGYVALDKEGVEIEVVFKASSMRCEEAKEQ